MEGNKTGTYTLDKQVINYYYQKKATNVITKYVDIDTDREIYIQSEQKGRIGDNYTTINELDNINIEYNNIYEFVKTSGNEVGTMVESTTVVTYYYQKKQGEIEVNYLEYETFDEAKMALFEYIEGWYNRKRIHSAINYQIPYEIEQMSA